MIYLIKIYLLSMSHIIRVRILINTYTIRISYISYIYIYIAIAIRLSAQRMYTYEYELESCVRKSILGKSVVLVYNTSRIASLWIPASSFFSTTGAVELA